MRLVPRNRPVHRRAHHLSVIVNGDAVPEHGLESSLHELAILESWRFEHEVVTLPFTAVARGVDRRRPLAVDRAGLSVGVSTVLEAVEHLNLVEPHEEDAAVAAPLAVAGDDGGRGPFEVKLDV